MKFQSITEFLCWPLQEWSKCFIHCFSVWSVFWLTISWLCLGVFSVCLRFFSVYFEHIHAASLILDCLSEYICHERISLVSLAKLWVKQVKMISQPILNCQRSKSFVYKITEYFEKLCNVIENTIVDKFVTEKNKRRVRINLNDISKKDHSLIFRPLVRLNRARFSNILVDFQPNFKP